MDFGLTLPNFHYGAPPTREHIQLVARAAEESGFTSVWASDHYRFDDTLFYPKPAATIRDTVDMNLAMDTPAADAAPDADMKGSFDTMRAFAGRSRTIDATDFIYRFEQSDRRAARRLHSRLWPRDHGAPVAAPVQEAHPS